MDIVSGSKLGEQRSPTSLTFRVYEALRSEILSCQLPPGAKIRIAEIAVRFDVSHAAVREALSRLVAMGWLEALDQRGFRVTELSLRDLMDVTQTRIDIETLALRRSIANGGSDWEAAITSSYQAMLEEPKYADGQPGITDEHHERHELFHRSLVSACNSEWLMHFRDQLSDQTQRYRSLSDLYEATPRASEKEHAELMQATLDRDADRASHLMAAHIRLTMDTILRAQTGNFELSRIKAA